MQRLLVKGDYNIIRAHWGGGSRSIYFQSHANTRLVGLEIALLVNTMVVSHRWIKFLPRNFVNVPYFHVRWQKRRNLVYRRRMFIWLDIASEPILQATLGKTFVTSDKLQVRFCCYKDYSSPSVRVCWIFIGLDPAGPYFHGLPSFARLDHTDANFVDVVHTNAGSLGDLR